MGYLQLAEAFHKALRESNQGAEAAQGDLKIAFWQALFKSCKPSAGADSPSGKPPIDRPIARNWSRFY